MDPMGGIVMTNDGNAILREITVQHPAAKSLIEIARTQDEEVGDGTTSVIVLAGEMLAAAEPFLKQQIHPTVIIKAYRTALQDMSAILQSQVIFISKCINFFLILWTDCDKFGREWSIKIGGSCCFVYWYEIDS